MLGLVEIFRLDPDFQSDVTATHGGEAVVMLDQVSRHQREQIARLGMRVLPGDEVTTALALATLDGIAVGEQDRVAVLVGDDGGGEHRHHVRAVRVVGDATEAFGLALGAEHARGHIKPFQRGIRGRVDHDHRLELTVGRQAGQRQVSLIELVFISGERSPIDTHGLKRQMLAIEHQRRRGITAHGGIGIGLDGQHGRHTGRGRRQIKRQTGVQHTPGGCLIIGKMNRCRL